LCHQVKEELRFIILEAIRGASEVEGCDCHIVLEGIMLPLIEVVSVGECEVPVDMSILGIMKGDRRWWWWGVGMCVRDWGGEVGEVLVVGQGEHFIGVVLTILPVSAIVRELDGELFVCAYGGCLDDVDGVPM
jgi:hypothetical protein